MGLKPADCNLLMAIIMNYANGNFHLHLGLAPSTPNRGEIAQYLASRLSHVDNLKIVEILELAEHERMAVQDRLITQYGDC